MGLLDITIVMLMLFCKEDTILIQGALKKLLTSPVIMQFYIWQGQNANIKKGYACVYYLLGSVASVATFSTWYFERLFL